MMKVFTEEEISETCERIAGDNSRQLLFLLQNRDLVDTLMYLRKFMNDQRQPLAGRRWFGGNSVSDEILKVFGERKLLGFEFPKCLEIHQVA